MIRAIKNFVIDYWRLMMGKPLIRQTSDGFVVHTNKSGRIVKVVSGPHSDR